ncbi:MAG: CopG family transcriptional regulator [Chloroflexota bacterium]
METIELTVDESLLAEVDRVIRSLAMTRATFVQAALEMAIRNQNTMLMERQHAQGYARHPLNPNEVIDWESEQVWGDL